MEYGPEGAASDARKIAEQKLLTRIPLDVVALAQALGLKVSKEPMAEHMSGYLRRTADGWVLGVNSLHHRNRQRFTIAHEIGHYMLHRDHSSFEDGLLFRKDANKNPQETEANQFASFLLMPKFEFQSALATEGIDAVAAKFGVSRQAAEYRINTLGSTVHG